MTRRSEIGGTSLAFVVAGAFIVACSSSSSDTSRTDATAGSPTAVTALVRVPLPSAWPEAMHDALHSGTSAAHGPRTGTVRWQRDLGADATPGPVIGVDGSVIVATHDGVLSSLDPVTGSTIWSYDAGSGYGNDLSTSAAILADGTIAWPGPSGTLYGISRSGELVWTVVLGGFVLSPAVASNGRVYAATMSGTLFAIDVAGARAAITWQIGTGSGSYGSPAIAPDGTIITTSSREVVAVSDDGASASIRWRHEIDELIEVSPAVSASGIVVTGSNDRMEYGLDATTGEVRWTVPRGDETYSSAIVTPGGLAYYGDHTATLYVVDTTNGTVVRSTTTRADIAGRSHGIWTAPAVDAEGAAYYGTRSGHVFGVASDGTVLFDHEIGGTVDSYPALGADGSLYIASSNGSIVAFGPG